MSKCQPPWVAPLFNLDRDMRTRVLTNPSNNTRFMMTSSNGNIFRVTGHLCGEFTGPRSPVNSPHKSQRRGALMFSLICAPINGWVNNGEGVDLRRHQHDQAHCDVIVMFCGVRTKDSSLYESPHRGHTGGHSSNITGHSAYSSLPIRAQYKEQSQK